MAQQLAFCADWETMTTRPTWALLVDKTGRSWSTVARAIKRLRDAGLVGVVKTGRDGAHQPAKCDAGLNDAAVYVLCVPATVSPVDEDDTLSDLRSGEESLPPHARESDGSSVPLRGPQPGAFAAPGAPAERDDVPGRPTDTPQEPRRPDERLAQAVELRKRVSALQSISVRHVRSIIREFARAGWTTGERAMAIDHRPDGTTWHHTDAVGVRNVGAWLAHR
ncbi:MAG: hypothetical protein J0I87_01645, partial [Cellulomonas sp.]|nr:hypothetical protein [Cellulomonas sp.]